MRSDRTKLIHITTRIRVIANLVMVVADCKAVSPPYESNIEAIIPSMLAQNIFCNLGASCRPPEVKVSTTIDPLSDEVKKKLATNKMASTELRVTKGCFSSNL